MMSVSNNIYNDNNTNKTMADNINKKQSKVLQCHNNLQAMYSVQKFITNKEH